MCGICGIAGFLDKELLKKMTGALAHRGPDAEGFYTDSNLGLGVRRLKIIDLVTGDQPIHNEEQSLWIVYNGEIYNFKELRSQLEKSGHKFYTNSDTEVIIHLYESYGKDCVHKLEGMFAFAIWDKKKKELFIARDRLGVKPLYYHYKDGNLRFASEIKSIIQDNKLSRTINPAALAYFFSFLYIPSPLSIFEDISKLPAGHTLSFKDGKLEIKQYWNLEFKDRQKVHTERDYIQAVRELLKESVKKRLISDVPMGVFLSGGIDSSAIVAMMRQITPGVIKTFSIGYGAKDKTYNELDYSQIVADRFNTEHHKFIVEPKITEILPEVVWHMDEPFADSSAIPTFLIAREARQKITTALTGTGGDEVFGGYPRYIGARLSLAYEKLPYFLRKAIMVGSGPFIKESLKSKNVSGWIKRFLEGGMLKDEERYISWMRCFDRNEEMDLFSDKFKEKLVNFDTTAIHKSCFSKSAASDFLDKIFYVDLNTYLVDDLLNMGDRMSMANSIEVRAPFCDHKLVELLATIPYQTKFSNFKLKGLLKKSLRGILPDIIIDRNKQGFMVPMGRWIKEDLKDYTLDILNRKSVEKRGIFNYSFIRELLDNHFKGRKVSTHHIYALLVLELWFREYLDNS
ncbi:MAG: asparagine synthase (glutamine-hydrolyzing) [Candidatus Omnitrophica bacterium]|nr:asparagine synthase (glutamine-hydrolyzing) [Candidatus Omnitrophota bacterium]